jgi:hypothetical protein
MNKKDINGLEYIELLPKFDARKNFYKKAIIIPISNGTQLQSYFTIVAKITNNKPTVFGDYSPTTLRHIKEYLKQNGFKAENKTQIIKDYLTK